MPWIGMIPWRKVLIAIGIALVSSLVLFLYDKLSDSVRQKRQDAGDTDKAAKKNTGLNTGTGSNNQQSGWNQADGLPRAHTVNVYNYGHVVNGGRDSVIRVNFADPTAPKGFKQEVIRTLELFQDKEPPDCCEGKITFEVPPHNKYRFRIPQGYYVPLEVGLISPGLKVLVGGKDIRSLNSDSIRHTQGVFEVENSGEHPVKIVIPYRKTPQQ
jgi:hypothetical protein